MRILVTGATGFVGRRLCAELAQRGDLVRAALRTDRPLPAYIAEQAVVGDIAGTTRWKAALEGVDAVIHLAARAHILNDAPENAHLYVETNTRGTECLAEAAAQAGVSRFLFLSSVKVNGEDSAQRAYTARDEPHPADAYGTSKWLAEKSLRAVAAKTGMQAAIVRSPLVYGPGVRANFYRLMRWVDAQWPLPFGAIKNRRSLVGVWNLCDLLMNLLSNPAAPDGTWMVSDGEDLSTPELIRRIGRAMNRRSLLPPVPVGLLNICACLAGRKAEIARLCGSLAVDIVPTREELGWSPPVSADEALARTVSWYLSDGAARGT